MAPDGSPVSVYLALPAGSTPELVDSQIASEGSILELGSGPGRITRPLVELGRVVVAVDNSAEMLANIDYAETVLADVFSLSLGREFDGVLAGSHLINNPDQEKRRALLSACRDHLAPNGVVLVERYEPVWASRPTPGVNKVGPVNIEFEVVEQSADEFRGRVTYTLNDNTWLQEFTAANVTDEMLDRDAESVGLRVAEWLDDSRTWARLAAADSI